MRIESAVPSEHKNRLIHTVYGWYALTREQTDLGPFDSPNEASYALSRHIRMHKGLNQRPLGRPQQMHLHDPDQCTKNNCALCVEARVFRHSLALAVS